MPQEVETKSWLETERGDQIPLQGICNIGRGESNQIVLNTSAVSRHHAVIHERDKEFWIVDLGGINGVQINGTRMIQPVKLKPGDRIKIPSALFVFQQAAVPVSEPTNGEESPGGALPPPLPAPKVVVSLTSPTAQNELALGISQKRPRVYVEPVNGQAASQVTVPLPNPANVGKSPIVAKEQAPARAPLPNPVLPSALSDEARKAPRTIVAPPKRIVMPEPIAPPPPSVVAKAGPPPLPAPAKSEGSDVSVALPEPKVDDKPKEPAPAREPSPVPAAISIEEAASILTEATAQSARPSLPPVTASKPTPPAVAEAAPWSEPVEVAKISEPAKPTISEPEPEKEESRKETPLAVAAISAAPPDKAKKRKKLPPAKPLVPAQPVAPAEATPVSAAKVVTPKPATPAPVIQLAAPLAMPPEAETESPFILAPVVVIPPSVSLASSKPLPAVTAKSPTLSAKPEPEAESSFILAPKPATPPKLPLTASKPLPSVTVKSSIPAAPLEKPKEQLQEAPAKPALKKSDKIKKPEPALAAALTVDGTLPSATVCRMAKQSQYIGLASIFLPFIGLISAVVAVVLGHRALKLIKRSNGALIGRESATMGLYFGYITMGLIVIYSSIFYAIYAFSGTSTAAIASSQIAPPDVPFIVAPTAPAPSTSANPSNTQASSGTDSIPSINSDKPSSPPSTDMATSAKSPNPTPTAVTPDLPIPPPSSAISATQASTPPAEPAPATPDAPSSPPAPAPIVTQNIPSPTPPDNPLPFHVASHNQPPDIAPLPAPKAPTLMKLMDDSDDLRNSPPTLNSPTNLPSPPTPQPAVYSPQVQDRLKDGMLSQPMPTDTSSRPYLDAEAFNNSARILAREPESKYAESVGDFLDDVKKRNPDPVRLQILTAMYNNYLAALKDQQ